MSITKFEENIFQRQNTQRLHKWEIVSSLYNSNHYCICIIQWFVVTWCIKSHAIYFLSICEHPDEEALNGLKCLNIALFWALFSKHMESEVRAQPHCCTLVSFLSRVLIFGTMTPFELSHSLNKTLPSDPPPQPSAQDPHNPSELTKTPICRDAFLSLFLSHT